MFVQSSRLKCTPISKPGYIHKYTRLQLASSGCVWMREGVNYSKRYAYAFNLDVLGERDSHLPYKSNFMCCLSNRSCACTPKYTPTTSRLARLSGKIEPQTQLLSRRRTEAARRHSERVAGALVPAGITAVVPCTVSCPAPPRVWQAWTPWRSLVKNHPSKNSAKYAKIGAEYLQTDDLNRLRETKPSGHGIGKC
jgi:hypothetical protein